MTYNAPGVIGLQITPTMLTYFERLLELGIFQGPVGNQQINPSLQPLIEAVHNVLAGGTVTVQTTTPGNAQIVSELDGLAADGLADGNEINKKLGFYLAAIP